MIRSWGCGLAVRRRQRRQPGARLGRPGWRRAGVRRHPPHPGGGTAPRPPADRRLTAVYHQLGIVAQQRGDLAAAEDWYSKSLDIKEKLGDRPEMASSYGQLGRVAQDRGDLAAAEAWYQKSLAIKEALGNRPGMATSYGQLGLLAEARGDLTAAIDWAVRCVALLAEMAHPLIDQGMRQLAPLVAKLGLPALEQSWQRCTGQPLPASVRAGVEQRLHEAGAG